MRLTAADILQAVWRLLPVAQRTVTVTTNNDKTGYTATASTVSDKTGYSLAATSAGAIKSIQRGSITVNGATSATGSLSPSVTVSNTDMRHVGNESNTNNFSEASARLALTNGSTITATKGTGSNQVIVGWEVTEKYG